MGRRMRRRPRRSGRVRIHIRPFCEEWRDVMGYEGSYKISSLGRLWSVPRKDASGRDIGGHMMSPRIDRSGYRCVVLCVNGIVSSVKIHRLVLEAFVGPCPDGHEAMHLDGNPGINQLDNLEYGTPSENSQMKLDHGTDNRGEKNGHHKLTEDEVLDIRQMHISGYSQKHLAELFCVSKSAISSIVHRINWFWL